MADEAISAMPHATLPLAGTELVTIVQGGVNKQCTVDELLTRLFAGLNAGSLTYFDGSKLATDAAIVRSLPGVVMATTFNGTSTVTVGAGLFTADASGNVVCVTVGSGTGTFQFNANGSFQAAAGTFVCTSGSNLSLGSLSIGGGLFTVDAGGNCTGSSLSSSTSFSGSGVFTTFTFNGGVCTTAA